MISFRIDWLDLLAVQGTLKSLLQHHSSKAPILRHSAFFIKKLQFLYKVGCPSLTSIRDHWKNHSFDYMTFVGRVMSLLFNMLSRLVIAFLPRSKRLLISWLQYLPAVYLAFHPAPPTQFSAEGCTGSGEAGGHVWTLSHSADPWEPRPQ